MTTPRPEPLEIPGPAQSNFLIHFCGRPSGRPHTPYVRPEIQALTPAQRLDNILWEQQILGFAPFGAAADQPMVCLSESPLDHLQWLLRSRGWPPWGVVLSRQWVFTVGGGPVWYARPGQYETLTRTQWPWAVRLGPPPASAPTGCTNGNGGSPCSRTNPAPGARGDRRSASRFTRLAAQRQVCAGFHRPCA